MFCWFIALILHWAAGRSPRRLVGLGSAAIQHRLDELVEPIRFSLNLRQEVTLRFLVPLHVGSAQATHETLDVTQRQPELVGGDCHGLISGSGGPGDRLLVRLQKN
jgi:hypothetical protein